MHELISDPEASGVAELRMSLDRYRTLARGDRGRHAEDNLNKISVGHGSNNLGCYVEILIIRINEIYDCRQSTFTLRQLKVPNEDNHSRIPITSNTE